MTNDRRNPQDVLLEKMTSLEVAMFGHPRAPADEGLMGDVKYIRRQIESHVIRLDQAEQAISAINARCEERAQSGEYNPGRRTKAKWLGGGGTVGMAIGIAIEYLITRFSRGSQ